MCILQKKVQPEYTVSIEKEVLGSFPRARFTGEIVVVDQVDKAERVLSYLSSTITMVGFDTETRPAFRKGQVNHTALMQISTDDTCYLFRLNKIGVIPALRDFLENPDITKIGLSLHDDFNVLGREVNNLTPLGFIDLQEMVKKYNISDLSLQKIFGILFGEYITKNQRLSNWEATDLAPSQQHYAALDAWACLKIYKFLISGAFDPEQCPYHKLIEQSVSDGAE